MGLAMEHRVQLQQVRSLLDPALQLGARHACHLQWRGDIVEDRHMRIIDEELMHQRDITLLSALSGDVNAIHLDAARCTTIKACHQLDERGLARSGLAEQDIEVSRLKAKGCLLDVHVPLDPLGDALEFQCHVNSP